MVKRFRKGDETNDEELTAHYVKEFLEETAALWNAELLKEALAEITGQSPRTIGRWLKKYRDNILTGVICKKKGRNIFYYAEKHKEDVEKQYKKELGLITEKENEIIQIKNKIRAMIKKEKEEDDPEIFEQWLNLKIRESVYKIPMNKDSHTLMYEEGMSEDLPMLEKIFEKWSAFGVRTGTHFPRYPILFLDAALMHSDTKIKKIAKKYYLYYRNRREDNKTEKF